MNRYELHRAGKRGNAVSQPQLNVVATSLGLIRHGGMADLIRAQQPARDELRDVPIPLGA
jgi:hypothetical protein